MLVKSAQEKTSQCEKRLQKTILEANGEITLLQRKADTLENGQSHWKGSIAVAVFDVIFVQALTLLRTMR